MEAADVVEFVQLLERHQIKVWLNGGWGVDALLGAPTRPHNDVDIVIQLCDAARLTRLLQEKSFAVQPGGNPWNFVLADDKGREVDVHAVTFDEGGSGHYGLHDEMWPPANALQGRGNVNGYPVNCLTPEQQATDHTAYALKEKDYQDMMALQQRFGVALPAAYAVWMGE